MYKLSEERNDVYITEHPNNTFTYEQFIMGRRTRPFMQVWQTVSTQLWSISVRIGNGNQRKDWQLIKNLSFKDMQKHVKEYLKDGSPCLR